MSRGVERRIQPQEKTMLFAEVSGNVPISPSLRRITLTGEGLRDFAPLGFDQWFRLFLPQPGHEDMRLPRNLNLLSYARFLTIPKRERPLLRNYTVSQFRPAGLDGQAELDVDFVVHGDEGFASRWAQNARPGSRVAILDEGILYVPPAGTERHLIIGDETALPAIAGILQSLGDEATGDVIVEVPDAGDLALLSAPPLMRVHGLVRAHGDRIGALSLARLSEVAVAPAGLYAFAIGESSIATGARRFLVSERRMPKEQVTFCGYWRLTD
jgi:NADPH-dependent ferric siderophore reductase